MKTRSLKIMRVLLKLFYSSRCLFHIFKVCVSKVTFKKNLKKDFFRLIYFLKIQQSLNSNSKYFK